MVPFSDRVDHAFRLISRQTDKFRFDPDWLVIRFESLTALVKTRRAISNRFDSAPYRSKMAKAGTIIERALFMKRSKDVPR